MSGNAGSARRRAVENWLRRRGLPLAVRHDRSAPQRSVPGLLALTFLVLWLDGINATVGQQTVVGQILVLATPVPTVAVGLLAARWMRRLAPKGRRLVTWVLFLALLLLGLVQALLPGGEGWWELGVIVILVAMVVAIVYSGLVSIFWWMVRIGLRRLAGFGDLVGRALPLLMLFTLFGFFGAEIWEAMDALAPRGAGRTRLWLVIAFLAVLTSTFLFSMLRDEAGGMIDRLHAVDVGEYESALRGTPVAGLVSGQVPRRPLTRPERLNIYLLLFVGHALQTLLVSVVVFAFFVAFGSIAVDRSVMANWVHHEPTVPGTLFHLPLPVPDELIKVSLFLAAFTGMYFAAQMALDSTYRTRFFEPLFAEVALTLVGRDVYRAVWDDTPGLPGSGPTSA